jgi:hypothetical protein
LDVVGFGFGVVVFVASAAEGAAFGCCSRSWLNIFDDSGDTGVLTIGFAVAGGFFGGTAGDDPKGLFATFGTAGVLAMGFTTGLTTGGGFADVETFATGVFGAALVDFARVVVFFVASGIPTSTGSEMTFLGLPLFFTTSEDMLGLELDFGELSLGEDSQKGNCEDRSGVILEDLMSRRRF